jgi:hypothetical protein
MTTTRVHVGSAVVWCLVAAGYSTKQIAAWSGLHANTVDRYRALRDPSWGPSTPLGARKKAPVPQHIGDIWRDFAPVCGMAVPEAVLVAGGLKLQSEQDRGLVYAPRVKKLWRSRPISSRVASTTEAPTALQALASAVEELEGRMAYWEVELRGHFHALSSSSEKSFESLARSIEKMAEMAPKIAQDAAAKVKAPVVPVGTAKAGNGTGAQRASVDVVQVTVWMMGQLLERVGARELARHLDVRADQLRKMIETPHLAANSLDDKARDVANLYALTQMEWSDLDEDDQHDVAQMMRRYRKETLASKAMSHRPEAV